MWLLRTQTILTPAGHMDGENWGASAFKGANEQSLGKEGQDAYRE